MKYIFHKDLNKNVLNNLHKNTHILFDLIDTNCIIIHTSKILKQTTISQVLQFPISEICYYLNKTGDYECNYIYTGICINLEYIDKYFDFIIYIY
jgi:hypothetical protein